MRSALFVFVFNNSVDVGGTWLLNVISVLNILVAWNWHFNLDSECFIDENFPGDFSNDIEWNLNSVWLVNVDGPWDEFSFLVVMVVFVNRQRVRVAGITVRESTNVCAEVSWSKSEPCSK